MAVFMCKPRTVDAVKYKGGLLFDSYPDWLIDMMREEDLTPAGADALWVGTGMGLRRLKDGDYILHNLSTLKTDVMRGDVFVSDYMPVVVNQGEE
ncbi:hypothetical protein [Alloscardovia omnicolens]|nr:hypothetical protein [Alloscardovia omnicolens]MDK6643107.1 hypothetical protein [Alloscardovia omnicolens]